jgi:glycosyltransferase involved in cell wall biosynthesis
MMDPRPLRVVIVADGDTVHHRRFARAIAGHGHVVSTIRWDELPVSGRGGESLSRAIAESRPDVLLAGPVPTVAADVVAATSVPVVVASWGSDLLVDVVVDATLAARASSALTRAASILVDCRTVEAEAVRRGASASRVVRFPWGIDLRMNRLHPLPKLGQRLRVVSLRSLEPGYRVDVLVAAAAEIDVDVTILGDGSAAEDLRRLAAELDVEERVRFLGRVDEVGAAHALEKAHLHVSTTPSDGSSISLLQALAIGRPSVVVDNPSNREWIDHGRTGWLVPAGEPAALAAAIEMARSSPLVLAEMAERGRALVEREADWAIHAQTLVRTLEEAVVRG